MLDALTTLLRLDSWTNALSGLGTDAFDKTVAGAFRHSVQKSDAYYDDLYDEDALARRICEQIPNEMTRAGFTLSCGDDSKDVVTALYQELQRLDVVGQIRSGMVWERVQGGAVVLIGADDGEADPSQPLNEAKLRSIASLRASDKQLIHALRWYPADHPKAGMPATYLVTPLTMAPLDKQALNKPTKGTLEIHETRMLVFPGGRVSQRRRIENWGWGHSALVPVEAVLRDYNMSWQGLTYMMQTATQDVWKFRGFKDAMTTGAQAVKDFFISRLRLSQMQMGPNRGIMIDSEGEDFTRVATQFTGIAPMVDQMCLRVCAAADGMPMTVLFGRSPAGMNATGESDMRQFYNTISGAQDERYKPQLERVLRLIMLCKDGPTSGKVVDGLTIKFNSLQQLTEVEQADVRLKQSQTDKNEFDVGAVSAEEIAISRHRPEGWSSETKIDLDARMKMLVADQVAAAGGTMRAADVQKTAFTGPQVASITNLLLEVAKGQIPPQSAIATLTASYPITVEDATAMVADLGSGFEPLALPTHVPPSNAPPTPPPPNAG